MARVPLRLVTWLAVGTALVACGADFVYFETNNLSGGPSVLVVRWSDDALDGVAGVVVRLDRIELLGPAGREVVQDVPSSYDLLTLRNGRYAEVARRAVPAGRWDALRFVLAGEAGGHHHVVSDEGERALHFAWPGGHVVDVDLGVTFEEDEEYVVHVDFDLEQSVWRGDTDWWLDPHLSLGPGDAAGTILGVVVDEAGQGLSDATVRAEQGGVSVRSTRTEEDGSFRLELLPAGRYDLVATGQDRSPFVEEGVDVLPGSEVLGVRLALARATGGGIEGRVPMPRPGLFVHVLGRFGHIAIVGVDPLTGSFTLPAVAPGSWTLELRDAEGRTVGTGDVLVLPEQTAFFAF